MLPQVESVSRNLQFAQKRFVHGLNCVPDDRLTWSPGGSATSALQIAGKVAGFLSFISAAIAAREMPSRPGGGPPPPPDSREAAVAAVEGGYARLLKALAGVTEEDLTKTMRAPWGQEIPISDWIPFVNQVAGYFQGQLNFLQLCYGDENPNIPPDMLVGR